MKEISISHITLEVVNKIVSEVGEQRWAAMDSKQRVDILKSILDNMEHIVLALTD